MMPDREKVIEYLGNEIYRAEQSVNDIWLECVEVKLLRDALALLKEQQQRIEALEIDRDILVKDINTNNCNTCKRQCEHRPELGDVVRVNCFMWKGR